MFRRKNIVKKDIFELVETEEGRNELKEIIDTNLPLVLEKRKKEGYYSLDKMNGEFCTEKLTDEQIDKIMANSNASVEMEGLTPSKEANEISRRFLKGEICDEEAKRQILKLSGIEYKPGQ
jgi:hypothetical protein